MNLPATKSWPVRVSYLLALPLALLALWLFPVKPVSANDCAVNRYYVDQDATGANDGTDWANANPNLQTALAAAETCPNVTQIWVAEGLYKPGATADDTFSIRPGLAVYGGFAGTENALDQRNWVSHVTVLSGDVKGNDKVDAHGVVTTTTNIVSPNAYHVVTMDGTVTPITGATRLDGFVVTAGEAHTGFTDPSGGGLYCNGQGPGKECSPTIANATFSGNSSENFGGAMVNLGYNNGKSSPVLNHVTFSGNRSGAGGAMFNDGTNGGTSSPALTHVTFSHNSAIGAGGAMVNNGTNGGTSSPVLNRVTFSHNSTISGSGAGGAMLNDGRSDGTSSPTLTDVTFTANSARDGGAMANDCSLFGGTGSTSSPTLNRVVFSGNSATRYGGGMYTFSGFAPQNTCSPALMNVVFYNNSADFRGGGMYTEGVSDTLIPVLTNVTFAANTGTAMVNQIDAFVAITPTISNTIFYGNDDQIQNLGSVVPAIHHSLVQFSGGSGGFWNTGLGFDGGGNLEDNPRFVDGANGDLRLRSDSPAIDVGDNSAVPFSVTTDIIGAPRVFDGDNNATATVDMGAYEFAFFPLNVARGGSGSGTVSNVPAGINCGADCTETLNSGTAVTLTATAGADSDFTGWSGACDGPDVCEVTVIGLTEVTATFSLKQYTVTVSANPVAGGVAGGGGTFTHGETVTVTAETNGGFAFANWTEGGVQVSTDLSYTFTATISRTLVAQFLKQYTVTVSADPVAGGVTSGGGTFTDGETVTVTATANSGYVFANWTEDGAQVSTDPSYGFTLTGDRTLVAHFSSEVYLPSLQR